jgi:DNA-binding LytR/AlgR family response regulator
MQLKMFVLSGAAVALWLIPLTALDKRIGWHKSMQGLSLCAAIACAVSAGNIAHELSEQEEIEAIKTRAITADAVDEIAVSAYISQTQRQQEAEAILASPVKDVEEVRERLEAIYSAESEEVEASLTTTTDTSLELARALYEEVREAKEVGKSPTWIIENILKMKGRKFSEGKTKLQELLKQFEG